MELNSNPEVPRKFPQLPRKFPDFPGGQPLSLGSLTPSPDSQKLSLRKSLEVRFDFGPRPEFSKQLFGSSWEGTKLDWTYSKQFLTKHSAYFVLHLARRAIIACRPQWMGPSKRGKLLGLIDLRKNSKDPLETSIKSTFLRMYWPCKLRLFLPRKGSPVFARHFEGNSFFFRVRRPPSKPFLRTQPVQMVAFPRPNRVVWRFPKEGILGKNIAWEGVGWIGRKKEKRMRKKGERVKGKRKLEIC